MTLPRRFPARLLAVSAAVLLAVTGCHVCQKVDFDEECRVPFDTLEIHYELDGYRGGYWSRALTLLPRAPGESMPNEVPDDSKGVTCQRAEIHILCPHPECGPDKARAVIRLWHKGRPMSIKPPRYPVGRSVARGYAKVDRRLFLPEPIADLKEDQCDPKEIRLAPEIFTLDCSRWEIEMILADLKCGGFFDDQSRPNGGAHLIVAHNGDRTTREWTPEPRLDDLLTRVSVDGRRVISMPTEPPLEPRPFQFVPGASEPGRIRLDGDPNLLPTPPEPSASPQSGKPGSESAPGKTTIPATPGDSVLPPLPPPSSKKPAPLELRPDRETPPFEETPPDDVLPPPLGAFDIPPAE